MADVFVCVRCKGKGWVRGRANPAAALVTFGLSFILQKAQTAGRCPTCCGTGVLSAADLRWSS